jgi:hypothetical protein
LEQVARAFELPTVYLEPDGVALVFLGYSPGSEIYSRFEGNWREEANAVVIQAAGDGNMRGESLRARMWQHGTRTWYLRTDSSDTAIPLLRGREGR